MLVIPFSDSARRPLFRCPAHASFVNGYYVIWQIGVSRGDASSYYCSLSTFLPEKWFYVPGSMNAFMSACSATDLVSISRPLFSIIHAFLLFFLKNYYFPTALVRSTILFWQVLDNITRYYGDPLAEMQYYIMVILGVRKKKTCEDHSLEPVSVRGNTLYSYLSTY